MRHVLFIILVFCCVFYCKLGTENSVKESLNPKLKRVLYWGYNGPEIGYVPNKGPESGINNKYPVWVDDSTLYTLVREGICKIIIDPVNLDYQSYQLFYFKEPDEIISINYDESEQKLFIVYNKREEPHQHAPNQAAYVTFSGDQVIIDQTIVEKSWDPTDIKLWHGKPGMMFYGNNPQTNIKGFYWLRIQPEGGQSDSLIYAIDLDEQWARGFSISCDGKHLFFGDRLGNRVLFKKLDISQPGQEPVVMADRSGSFIATSPHPSLPHQLLINYHSSSYTKGLGAHIELLNVDTFKGIDLDVRVNEFISSFIFNENPKWSPDGNHFIFSGGNVLDREMGAYVLDLWIYRNVP